MLEVCACEVNSAQDKYYFLLQGWPNIRGK